jgi:hypothetical protein
MKPGVNFIVGSVDATPALDPQTRREPVHVEDFEMKADVALSNVTLKKVLQTLIDSLRPPEGFAGANPVVYSVEDYALVFHQQRVEDQPLYTRTYKLNPNVIAKGLDGIYLSQNPFLHYAHVVPESGVSSSGPGSYFQFGSDGNGVRRSEGSGIVGVTISTNSSTVIENLRDFFVAAV